MRWPAIPSSVGRRAVGFIASTGIAVIAWELGIFVPLVGAPIVAIVIGAVLANTIWRARQNERFGLGDVSSYTLKAGIVALGFTLNIGDVLRTGTASVAVLITTIAVGLAFALFLGRILQMGWRIPCLIGIGTTICGASAIAVLAPVLRAKGEEISYSISVIFLFNMIAVFVFPLIGHALGLSDRGFGLWTGTAVNDTSAVVAAGFAFSKAAGTYATIVKLTRTTFIIPLVVGFGLAIPRLSTDSDHNRCSSLLARVRHAFPVFIVFFLAASCINTLGLVGNITSGVQTVARFILVVALAAIGLQSNWRTFARAGLGPLGLGLGTWLAVASTSLAVQYLANQV